MGVSRLAPLVCTVAADLVMPAGDFNHSDEAGDPVAPLGRSARGAAAWLDGVLVGAGTCVMRVLQVAGIADPKAPTCAWKPPI